jgi:1,4-alpha-glucan branching enzyme
VVEVIAERAKSAGFKRPLQLLLENEENQAAVTAVYLLLPQIRILFMGEEFGISKAFPPSRDFEPELAEAVRERRRGEFARFSFGRWIAAALRYEPVCPSATARR